MANAIIDRENRTITITKAFNAKASIYNSEEYRDLAKIQNAHPNFRIIVKAAKRKSIPLGRITYEQMEKYIREHDTTGDILKKYFVLRGKNEDGTEREEEGFIVNTAVSFFKLKKWFIKTFPEIEEMIEARKNEVNEIMKVANA